MELLDEVNTFPRSQEFIERLASTLDVSEIDDTSVLQTGAVILRNAVDEDAVERAFCSVNFTVTKQTGAVPLKRSGQYNYLARLGTNNNPLFEIVGSVLNDIYQLSRAVQVQYNEYISLDGQVAGGGFHTDIGVSSPVVLMGAGLGCTAFVAGDEGIIHGNDAHRLDVNRSPYLDDRCEAATISRVIYGGRDLVVATQPQRLHAGQTIADEARVHRSRRTIVVVAKKPY